MKKLSSFLLSGIAILAALCWTSCSDSPDLDGKISEKTIENLSRQGSIATYERVDLHLYNKDALSNGKWEEEDLSELCGWWSSLPGTMVFQDGQLWRELELFFSYGPHPLSAPWKAYLKATSQKISLYIAPKFIYDRDAKTFMIGENEKFDVIDFTDKKLTLSHVSPYDGGRTGEGGEFLEISSYRIADPITFDGPGVVAFESTKEAYRYILDCAREQFGRYIDMNELYYPSVIFDDPIIDLDQIEEELIRRGEL